jgi:hypothetical protein
MTQSTQYAPNPAPQREAIAWAVIDGGKIKVKTVSDTRRAAMVNWLVTEREIYITANMSDEQIERLWFRHRQGAEIEYVTVTRAHTEAKP